MDQFVTTLMNVEIVHVIQMQYAEIHLVLTAAHARTVTLETVLTVQVKSLNFDILFSFFITCSIQGIGNLRRVCAVYL